MLLCCRNLRLFYLSSFRNSGLPKSREQNHVSLTKNNSKIIVNVKLIKCVVIIRNIFGIAIDCLGKQGGIEEIVRVLNEMGKNHRRRGIPKKAFVELRVIVIEVLSQVCHLDDEGKEAWNDLIDVVYHVLFTNLDDKRIL